MQQRSCEHIALLLSKYADGEATPAERQSVESHVAGCADCARRLSEYQEIAFIFSGTSRRDPEPQLRVNLFKEIDHLKEEERRKERSTSKLPFPLPVAPRVSPVASRFWAAASPFVVASAAVFTILGLALLFNKEQAPVKPPIQADINYPPVPTSAPIVADVDTNQMGIPGPESTKLVGVWSPSVPASATTYATAYATAISEGLFPLSEPTPIMESGDPSNMTTWHTLRDPAYGYSVSYPPNWWTYVSAQSRMFMPWSSGAGRTASYWIDMRVLPNTQGLTAANANARYFGGKATPIPSKGNSGSWVRYNSADAGTLYDELYSFDANKIYVLRLGVPRKGTQGAISSRWLEADALLSRMSGTFSLPGQIAQVAIGYAPVPFLNGNDLYAVEPNGQSRALTQGYNVRQFALSPDMRTVAFTSARSSGDIWASFLYVVHIDGDAVDKPQPMWTSASEIHDIAWYSDRVLLVIGATGQEGLGIFNIPVPNYRLAGSYETPDPQRLVAFDDTMAGARGLAVSPDRQLITFLAPLGEKAGTDIYAVRPDGTDLGVMLSHADPVSPSDSNGRILSADSQAIKSYIWTDGHLDNTGYRFHILLTCGNDFSPTFYRGGFLYSAPGAMRNVLLNQAALQVPDPNKMQVVHLAYAPDGRLALTGYYYDYKGRADLLAGLWTTAVGGGGSLGALRAQPIPDDSHGITDLQWSPDGKSLIYRETITQDPDSLSSRYNGSTLSAFSIVQLDPDTGHRTVLYSSK